MRFFKTVLAVIVGFFTSIFLTLLIFIGMASFFAPKEDLLEIKDNSILSLDFQEEVHEYGNPIHIKDFDYDISEDNTLTAILRAIEYAKTDKQIKGIVLKELKDVLTYKTFVKLWRISRPLANLSMPLAKELPNRTICYRA